jgi:hypothetical protein
MGRRFVSFCLLSGCCLSKTNHRILITYAPDGFPSNLLLMLCAKVRAAASNRFCNLRTGGNGPFAQWARLSILNY